MLSNCGLDWRSKKPSACGRNGRGGRDGIGTVQGPLLSTVPLLLWLSIFISSLLITIHTVLQLTSTCYFLTIYSFIHSYIHSIICPPGAIWPTTLSNFLWYTFTSQTEYTAVPANMPVHVPHYCFPSDHSKEAKAVRTCCNTLSDTPCPITTH